MYHSAYMYEHKEGEVVAVMMSGGGGGDDDGDGGDPWHLFRS